MQGQIEHRAWIRDDEALTHPEEANPNAFAVLSRCTYSFVNRYLKYRLPWEP